MIPLNKPSFTFDSILSRLPGGPKIAMVEDAKDFIVEGELEYEEAAPLPLLHSFPRAHENVNSEAEGALKYAYQKFASKRDGGEAHDFYETLFTSSNDRCPWCLQTPIAALDHYLPKSKFARLALVPSNLVPICHRCNTLKLDDVSYVQEDLPLHPYFDRIGGMKWLRGTLIEDGAAPIIFSVERLSEWDDLTETRVQNHFDNFALNAVWQASTAKLLTSLGGHLRTVLITGGSAGLRTVLESFASSYHQGALEPWHAVAMRAWADSDWFCAGEWSLA